MMAAPSLEASPPIVDWAVSARALAGEAESGDLHVVADFPGGALVAAIDGLGHGPEAAAAARAAATILHSHANEPVIQLVQRCHEELHKTRGVALSVASLHVGSASLAWLAVGNVEGMLFRADKAARPARESILLRSGVVGYQIPPLRAAVLPVWSGDTLVFATDGISGGFDQELSDGRDLQNITDDILLRFGKKTDDALVLAARYRGPSP
jgi:negative regulator of sigma-B (phosphoserine phosphatase)